MTWARFGWLLMAAISGALVPVAAMECWPASVIGAFGFLYFVNRFLG